MSSSAAGSMVLSMSLMPWLKATMSALAMASRYAGLFLSSSTNKAELPPFSLRSVRVTSTPSDDS